MINFSNGIADPKQKNEHYHQNQNTPIALITKLYLQQTILNSFSRFVKKGYFRILILKCFTLKNNFAFL